MSPPVSDSPTSREIIAEMVPFIGEGGTVQGPGSGASGCDLYLADHRAPPSIKSISVYQPKAQL